MNLKRFFSLIAISLVIILFSGCADVTPVQECVTTEPYGFFSGLWHGFIAPFSFIGSIISDDIAMYAVNNTGGWYDFGFVLVAVILTSGSLRK